ncbi:MAG: hypothetical protein ABIK10_06055 [candidate division WOR-3 bacterium]
MVAGILVGHGELPYALYNTVKRIIGEQDNFVVISNERLSAEELKKNILLAIEKLKPHDIIIFTDLLGGSCAIASRQILAQAKENVGIISGVNVGMLIKYFQYRSSCNFSALLTLVADCGKAEIVTLTTDKKC